MSLRELTIVKAGVTLDTPYDIRAYQEDNPSFPCDGTLNQLYNAQRFDAYRALGEYSMDIATGTVQEPDQQDGLVLVNDDRSFTLRGRVNVSYGDGS